MPRISLTRRLLQSLTFPEVKEINGFFDLPPRKSKDEMVTQVVYLLGSNLQPLISSKGPYSLVKWNAILTELDGYPRHSFDAVIEELRVCLDPVFDEFDGDSTLASLRETGSLVRTLARKLGVTSGELSLALNKAHGGTSLRRFIIQFREAQRLPTTTKERKRVSVSLASTRITGPSIDRLSHSSLHSHFLNADEIAIAAGFYDVEFLSNLLARHSRVKRVRLIFNKLGGTRLLKQCEELQNLEIGLSTPQRSVSIRLLSAPGMFHTKLFIASEQGDSRALVGSANATDAAFIRNEEILVSLPEAQSFVAYFDAAWLQASSLKITEYEARSLIAFFRTGTLYFRPVVSLSTTLNPFRELLRLLTEEERNQLGALRLPHADSETGIGAFNLRLAMRLNMDDESRDELVEDINSGDLGGKAKASIRPWSIETCFGYWVPSAVEDIWQEKLERAGAHKKQKWIEFRKLLNQEPIDNLLNRYHEYLAAVRELLEAVPSIQNRLGRLARDPFDEVHFIKFLNRVVKYLEDDSRVERLARPFTSGPMPEIWDDGAAFDDFRMTFFEYLNRVARLTSNQPRVPGKILNRIGADETRDTEQLQSDFEEYLQNHGWKNIYWK